VNFTAESCDLWEEIRSDDMFWNKYTMRRALRLGADFAQKMGDSARASTYRAKVAELETQLNTHWNGS
jgi:glucoamylase